MAAMWSSFNDLSLKQPRQNDLETNSAGAQMYFQQSMQPQMDGQFMEFRGGQQ